MRVYIIRKKDAIVGIAATKPLAKQIAKEQFDLLGDGPVWESRISIEAFHVRGSLVLFIGGPADQKDRAVGPFDLREDAEKWLVDQRVEYDWTEIHPLEAP